MMKILSAASVLAIAAGAHAAPFNTISHTSGGAVPGINGPGIFVSEGGFFDADGAEIQAPGTGTFTGANAFEFDSYIALNGFGPSARGRVTAPANNSAVTRAFYGNYPALNNNPALGDHNSQGGTVGPGSHVGDLFLGSGNNVLAVEYGLGSIPPHTTSTFAPNAGGGRSTFDGVFLGRLTIPLNAVLSGGILLNVRIGATAMFDSAVLPFSGSDDVAGTPALFDGQLIALTAFRITTHEAGVLSGSSDENAFGDFGAARTVDLWAHVIPTPGTLALLGLGGLAAARRRRA